MELKRDPTKNPTFESITISLGGVWYKLRISTQVDVDAIPKQAHEIDHLIIEDSNGLKREF